jgi:hypothetical protein
MYCRHPALLHKVANDLMRYISGLTRKELEINALLLYHLERGLDEAETVDGDVLVNDQLRLGTFLASPTTIPRLARWFSWATSIGIALLKFRDRQGALHRFFAQGDRQNIGRVFAGHLYEACREGK